MASNQDSYKTLQQELRRQFPNGDADWSHDKAVSGVPYLDYVLLESLRLRPPVPGGLNRTAPPAGLTIDGIHIPGDTVMTVPTWTIQRDPRYWSDPLSFKPERWASLSTESVPFIAFTRGRWVCPGRALAMMEMRTLIGRMALRFDMALAEDGAKFEAGMKDTFTMTLPPLPLVFTPVDA